MIPPLEDDAIPILHHSPAIENRSPLFGLQGGCGCPAEVTGRPHCDGHDRQGQNCRPKTIPIGNPFRPCLIQLAVGVGRVTVV